MLSSAALDEALRSEAAYGLDGYALSSASYTLVEAREEGEEDQVLCALYYVASGEDYRSRTFTVDARTGAVQSIWSSAPWLEEGESPALTGEQAQARAEDYLSRLCGGRWDALALAAEESLEESRRPYYTFTYVRQSDGIPFPENYYAVAIDAMDGSVYRLDYVYGEDVTFASPEGIVDEAAALAAWAGTYETTLAYRLVPRALDSGDETEARLMELGAGYWYGLRLTYGLEREDDCRGIDAATGEPVWQEAYDSAITYTDLEGTWAQADAEKLAAYGVGYDGGLFQHRKSLTQWDLVALMASLEGYRIDPENADQWERGQRLLHRLQHGPAGPRRAGRRRGGDPRRAGQAASGLCRLPGGGPAGGHLRLHPQRRGHHPGLRPGLRGPGPGPGDDPGGLRRRPDRHPGPAGRHALPPAGAGGVISSF